jgi:hypothetical protein
MGASTVVTRKLCANVIEDTMKGRTILLLTFKPGFHMVVKIKSRSFSTARL